MSWSYNKTGRAGKLAEVVGKQIIETQGCPAGSAEERAKNAVGGVIETLCASLPADKVVQIEAQGSAYNNPDGTANYQSLVVKLTTVGDFVE